MGKRVAVVLSGCGPGDGSEIRESVLATLSLERAGAEVTFAAPDVEQTLIFDHLTGAPISGAPPRRVLSEAARIARGKIRPLSEIAMSNFDALVFPGGNGVGSVLSNYHEKAERCDVLPDVARLLKDALARHRPIGLICLAPILAARVLGPVAGVHLTLGARGTAAYKHASVMGADVRPCPASEIFVDRKNRVVSTPAYMYDDVRLQEVAQAIDKLVRALFQLTQGARPFDPTRDQQPRVQRPAGDAKASQGDRPSSGVVRRPGGRPHEKATGVKGERREATGGQPQGAGRPTGGAAR
jgi:enhancing lycopene biosynthesis protein 2